jgi:hypothetical protein
MDLDAIEPKVVSKGNDADDDADGLAAMFGSLGVTNARRCQVCQTEYVFIGLVRLSMCDDLLTMPLEDYHRPPPVRIAPNALFSLTRPAANRWQDLPPTFLPILLRSGRF